MPRIVQNRRALMRIAFVVACILPTLSLLVISTVALARRSAAEANEYWRSSLELQLGLTVEIERVELATRGVTLHDVAIRHPESLALIVRIRQVYIAQVAERGWIVDCRYPELNADRFPDIWNILNDRLTNRRGTTNWSGTLTATNIAWREGANTSTIPEIRCNMRHSAEVSECKVEYFLEEQDPQSPSSLVISRDRESRESSITYDWETTSGPFPLRWLWPSNPGLKHLGREAAFDGRATIRRTLSGTTISGTTSGNLEGEIRGVDLSELVSRPFPHHILRGRAVLEFTNLRWEANRMSEYSGTLSSDNGRVSRSLLDAARHVGLKIPVRLTDHPLFGYRQLHLRFAGSGEAIQLYGADADNVILVGDVLARTPLLMATGAEADTAGLLRWMVPYSSRMVPATPQVGALAKFFQLPAIDPGDPDSLPTPVLNLGPPIVDE